MMIGIASAVPAINAMVLPVNVGLSAMTGNRGEAALSAFSAVPFGRVGASVWKLGNFSRGIAIETALGKNLAAGFPVIDRFLNGTATSIKSVDLTAKTYQDTRTLASTLDNYIEKVADFKGAVYGTDVVQESQIVARELQVAIPKGSMSAAQRGVFNAATKNANRRNIILTITEIE